MPLDLRGFTNEPNQWAGLYHAADTLEKNKLRADQLAISAQAKRNAAGTFLQNYLDPKDFLTGTAFDPMLIHGLQTATEHGAQLAAAGADSPTLMMALGPMVNKLATYAANAKNINKQVDDQISKMKESGAIGYDYAKLKDESIRNAFYKTDEKTGQSMLDPDNADPTVNWIQKAIEKSPERVTTSQGFDQFADKAKMKTLADSVKSYDSHGNDNETKYNLKFQEYMTPERDIKGKVTRFVPLHDVATEKGNPLIHTFTDASGKEVKAPVRLLDESTFDTLPEGLIDNIKGQVKAHLNEYETATGEKIPMGSPKAKYIARALAYNELNSPHRNFGSIEHAGVYDKPSSAQVNLNIGSSPAWLNMLQNQSQAREQGRQNVVGMKGMDAANVLTKVFNNDPDVLANTNTVKDGRQVHDITGMFTGGGLKAGRGVNYKYKGIYYDPDKRGLLIEKETKDRFGIPHTETETITEDQIGPFMYKIGPANVIPAAKIKTALEQMGYKDGKFTKPGAATTPEKEFENRLKQSWRNPFTSLFKNSNSQTQ